MSETIPYQESQHATAGLTCPQIRSSETSRALMARTRIFYLCPDIKIQSAGIRRLYRHVRMLDQAGFDARIMHLESGFSPDDHSGIRICFLDRHRFDDGDIIVIPEGCPTVMHALKERPGRRFAIALNWDYVFGSLPSGMDWRTFNIERVLTVSPVIGDLVSWAMGLPIHVLGSSIDHRLYHADHVVKAPRIAYISRKAFQVAPLKRMMGARNSALIEDIEWMGLDGLPVAEYARRIRESTLFLNLSMAEGFPTSCLEAMACGTLVTGYDSIGGRELLRGQGPDRNCISAPTGDYLSLAYALEPALMDLLAGNFSRQWAAVIENGVNTAGDYLPEAECASLIKFWSEICASGPGYGMNTTEAEPHA